MNNEVGTNTTKKFDLEDRLIDFVILTSKVVDSLHSDRLGNHIGGQFGGQLTRSGASPALNYGEAQAAESRSDFIHKMKVCLKEIRESRVCLKIILKKPLSSDTDLIKAALQEVNELASIFNKSILTAEKNK